MRAVEAAVWLHDVEAVPLVTVLGMMRFGVMAYLPLQCALQLQDVRRCDAQRRDQTRGFTRWVARGLVPMRQRAAWRGECLLRCAAPSHDVVGALLSGPQRVCVA